MSQDLREMFKNNDSEVSESMKDGHEQRFLKRMEKDLPVTKKRLFPLFTIAATFIILIGLGTFIYLKLNVAHSVETTVVEKGSRLQGEKGISLR